MDLKQTKVVLIQAYHLGKTHYSIQTISLHLKELAGK